MSDHRPAVVEPLEPRSYYAVVTPQVIIDVAIVSVSQSITQLGLDSLPVGSHDFAKLTLLSPGTAPAKGAVDFRIYASANNKFDSADRLLIDSLRTINIPAHATSTQRFDFTYPLNLP